jgi:hypothetical protein
MEVERMNTETLDRPIPSELVQPMADEDGEGMAAPEADPGFQAASAFVMQKLYEEGAAEKVARAVRAADDPMTTVADIAYRAVDEADAAANPPMMEENLVPLAVFTLSELWEVAAAAMKQDEVDPALVAGSFKIITLRFLQETGADTSELQQAFDQVPPDAIRQASREVA